MKHKPLTMLVLALLAAAVLTFLLMRWIFGKITAKKAFNGVHPKS